MILVNRTSTMTEYMIYQNNIGLAASGEIHAGCEWLEVLDPGFLYTVEFIQDSRVANSPSVDPCATLILYEMDGQLKVAEATVEIVLKEAISSESQAVGNSRSLFFTVNDLDSWTLMLPASIQRGQGPREEVTIELRGGKVSLKRSF